MTKRHYGLDLFRFVGAFIILAGHLTALIGFTPIESIGGYFSSPLFWYGIISAPVPVFFMISGYFSLVRPNREDEVQRTTRSFFNILQKYAFWIIVFVIANNVINGGSILGSIFQDIITALFNPITYTVAAIMPIVSQGRFMVQTAPLWYLYTFMGFILVAPLLKAFMAKSDIKLVRFIMIVLFVGGFVWPNLNTWANTTFAENAFINGIFTQSSLFDLNRFAYSLSFYYMLGAWLNLEDGYKKFVESRSIVTFAVIMVIGIVSGLAYTFYASSTFTPTVNAGSSAYSAGYESLLLLPAALGFFMFFNKLDEKLNDEGGLGLWVKKHSAKTLGIYIVHVFVIAIIHNIVGFANVNAFFIGFENPIVQCLVYFLSAVVIYAISFGFITVLRKIPVLKRFV